MLTKEQAEEAYNIGLARYEYHAKRGTPHKYKLARSPDNAVQDAMGAVAEATVAAFLGMGWVRNVKGADKGADVGGCVGVRWTKLRYGSLVLHHMDRDDYPFVLVTGETHTEPMRMAGWLYARAGKNPRYWRTDVRDPAFFVPQRVLQPMNTLADELSNWGQI